MVWFFVCGAFLIFLVAVLWKDTVKPIKYPPGPKFLPIVGNYLQFIDRLKVKGYHHLVWEEFAGKYGEVVGLKLGRNYVVAVFGAEAVKEVLMRDEFDGRPDGYFFRLRTFGKRLGIVFSDGHLWKSQRKFSLQHLRHFGFGRREMEEKIQEEAQVLINNFQKQCKDPLYMHTIFDISVLNVLWAMMAGERFQVDDERLNKLLQIIHDAFRLVDMSGGLLNQMPYLRFIAPDFCGYTQVMEILNRMWDFLKETINEHRKALNGVVQPRDLIEAFLQKMDVDSDSTFTDDQLMSLLLDLFMAGAETTSNTLSFACIYMILYPQVQSKVQHELDTIIGRNRCPTLQDRNKLKYTEAVLMEIQRRANIPPLGIAHRATCDADLFGYRIPEGTMILTSLYSVHMDEKFWIDPFEFRPERFLDAHGNISVNEKYFLPFGIGKRRCLGESLGKCNLFIFFTSLLHNFTLEKCANGPQPQLDGLNGVTISPKPFKAKLIPRN